MADQAQGLRLMLAGGPLSSRTSSVPGRSVAVVSGKGGVGKTLVSTNLAVVAARRGLRTVVIDGDLGLANADVVLGARPTHTLEEVLAGQCTAQQALVTGVEGVCLLAGGSGPSWLARMGPEARLAMKALLGELERSFDLVIIDCGAGIGDTVLFLAGLADERLLVVTPEPTAIVDAYAMSKAMSDAGIGHATVVVNCALTQTEAEACFSKLEAVAARFLPIALSFAGSIARDDAVRRAVMGRRPVVVDAPSSRASQGFLRLEGRLSLTAGARRPRLEQR